MSYLVLALKHRPQKFDELIGQEHISEIISKSIENNRVAHSFLFSGPRGIGKTSCARILAKCLNCETGPTVNPCGKCSSCLEIAKGTSFDVLEIDGASNRGIDEIRALRENVKFAANFGRYKVYIVDEVHMLTTEAFNALLKTLEEPPEHVKFIFATTEPQKVPATIISRCQRFDFKRISIKTTVEGLSAICKKEKFKVRQDALYAIAKAAQGSMRDALSILDQLSVAAEKEVGPEDVFSMLGLVETQFLFDLSDAIASKNCLAALDLIEKIVNKGKDVKQLLKDIIEHFRNLMIIKIGGKSLGKLVDYPIPIKEMLLKQGESFTLKEIIKTIDLLIEAQEVARITESIRMPLEVAFAKLTYTGEKPAVAPMPERAAPPPATEKKISPMEVLKSNKGEVDIAGKRADEDLGKGSVPKSFTDKPAIEETEDEVEVMVDDNGELIEPALEPTNYIKTEIPKGSADLTVERVRKLWDTLTHQVSKKKMSVATYLQSANPVEFDGTKLVIGFSNKCTFHKESLETQDNIKLVESVFSEALGRRIIIKYAIVEDFIPQEEAAEVKDVLDTFGGEIISKWHSE